MHLSVNPFSLAGKHILVTGASSGIGRAIAIACSGMGATLYLTGRNTSRLHEILLMLYGEGHQMMPADLTKADELTSLVQSLPLLDGIVQNAGVGARMLCKNIQTEDINDIFSLNFEAPVLLQKALLEQKKIKKEASVVFIASRAAEVPSVGNAIYSASKGAIISYANVLALELAPRKIRVNCISPAMVWTDLISYNNTFSVEEMEAAQQKYLLKRYGKPEDVAYLTVYLLSEASSWMTGSNINITGGS